jgi:hypothetical protein
MHPSKRAPDLEQYVAEQLEQTRLTIQRLRSSERSLNTVTEKQRLQQAETYARWRYASWLKGEVVRL